MRDFRQRLYEHFHYRADALFNLLDSLSGNQHARAVVELSLNPLFDREYSSLHDAVDNFFMASGAEQAQTERTADIAQRMELLAAYLPEPESRRFWLFGIDTTAALRPFAQKLADRGVVYRPHPAPGNKPIGIGHSYSVLALLPEREAAAAPWVVPLSCLRVPTTSQACEVAAQQVEALLTNPQLPFGQALSVEVVDSHYSRAPYLSPTGGYDHHVVIARLAANRTLYRLPLDGASAGPGHPRWYGEAFKLSDERTWGLPDHAEELPLCTRQGRRLQVKLQRWNDLLMRGKRDAPMYERPLDLIRCTVTDEHGKAVFRRPMWLVVVGKRRREITLVEVYEAYRQRFDLEHFFRFGKNKLLLDKYQTTEVEHEENWWELVCLAYVHLWLAAPLAVELPMPWERYLRKDRTRPLPGPSQVQRDFGSIIRQIGTPAQVPKRRGNSPGRAKGQSPGLRPCQPVVFKSKKRLKKAA